MWYFPLSVENEDEKVGKEENNLVNNVYEQKTQAELAMFLHATFFSLVKLNLIKAVKNGNLATWTGLTAELISRYLLKSEATIFGHLYQRQENTVQQKLSIWH